jgi:hypothetical protein
MTDKANHNNDRVRSGRPSWVQENKNIINNNNHQNRHNNNNEIESNKSHQNPSSSSSPPPPPRHVSVLEFGVPDSISTMVTLLHEAALPDFSDVQVVTFRDILALHPSVVAALVQLFRCVPRRRFLQVELTNCCCCWWYFESGSGIGAAALATDSVMRSPSHNNNNNNKNNDNNDGKMEYDETENQFLVSLLASVVLWADNVRGLTLETPFLTEEMILTLATALQCNCPTLELTLNVNLCSEKENDEDNKNDDNNSHNSAATTAVEDPAADAAATATTTTTRPSTTTMVAQVLGQSLRHNTMLQTLDLTGCHWDPSSVQQFANGLCGNVHLQTLSLSKGQLLDHDLAFFLTKVFQSPSSSSSTTTTTTTTRTSAPFQLRDLNVSGNGARSKTMQVLSQLLQSRDNFPFLAQLDFSDQIVLLLYAPDGGGGEERTLNMTPLFEALCSNVTLTHLNVSGNAPFPIDTTDYDDDDNNNNIDDKNHHEKTGIHPHCPIPMMELAKVLQQNTTLTHLVLSQNCISDQDLKEMALGWKTNTALQLVDLQQNDITDQGILEDIVPIVRAAAAAAAATRAHHKPAGGGGLHTLYLAGNAFLATGAQAILASTLGGRIQTDIVNVWTEKGR